MCGTYQEKFDGELSAALATEEDGYVLAVHQGMNAFTLFFTGMVLETHLFDYGHTGHFWVKGYEYLRQLEYRLAILHDKLEYLGEEFCSKEERQLASLAEFPPLNYCCYPAVPKKYRTVTEPDWRPSEAALQVMCELAEGPEMYHFCGHWKGIAGSPGDTVQSSLGDCCIARGMQQPWIC